MIINKQILVAAGLGLAHCANGQDYFKVFVSSATYDGNLGGIAGADEKCQTLANDAGLGHEDGLGVPRSKFRAWISGSVNGNTLADTFNSIDNNNKGFKLVDRQTTVATSWADLTDGTLVNNINMDEYGNDVTNNTNVWTGKDGTSNDIDPDCQGWTSNSATAQGVYGDLNGSGDGEWTNTAQDGYCDSSNRIYCFQYEVPCQGGYEYNSMSLECEDVDECSPPTAAGGDGTTGDGVDPLAPPLEGGNSDPYPTTPPLPEEPDTGTGTGNTGGGFVNPCNLSTSTCENTEGSYKCECLPGYSNNDQFTCVNINECAGVHGCDDNSNCEDNNGSYECQCKDGYWVADGRSEFYEPYANGNAQCANRNECQ